MQERHLEFPEINCAAASQVFGKFNIAETLRQQGINPCTIAEGKNADAQFPFSDWTPEQERLVNRLVDHIYAGFIRKVLVSYQITSAGVVTRWCPLMHSARMGNTC